MLCPRRGADLARARQSVEIDTGPECRGVWLDRGELQKILREESGRLDAPRPHIARRPVKPAARPEAVPQQTEDAMLHFYDRYDDRAGALLLAEYRELPALRLTAAQAGRLLAIEPQRAQVLLQALVARGLLRITPDRRYVDHRPPCRRRQLAGIEEAALPPGVS